MAPDEFLFEYKERKQKEINCLIVRTEILQNELDNACKEIEKLKNENYNLRIKNSQPEKELNKQQKVDDIAL